MTMTKTVELMEIVVRPNVSLSPADPSTVVTFVTVNDRVTVDDPDDDTLPITQTRSFNFKPGDDVSGQDQIVQDICAAVWTDA
jgi:hypothetical protein